MTSILLIHHDDAPIPCDPEPWARLSEDEQHAVFRDYQAVSETPGVTSSMRMELSGAAIDAAIQLAARIPAARRGGAIEGRPLVESR